ncbi:MAG: hypothetical protein ABSA47_20215 [Verrucomicrobiota bacterium]
MQAQFEMKVQVIRSKGRATRLFVNVPLPLAAALDLQAGERVRCRRANGCAGNCWLVPSCG